MMMVTTRAMATATSLSASAPVAIEPHSQTTQDTSSNADGDDSIIVSSMSEVVLDEGVFRSSAEMWTQRMHGEHKGIELD